MEAILVPHSEAGWLDARATQLALDLRQGRPVVGWRGDPNLELRLGIMTDRHHREVARRWEVWRHCEDGADRRLADWALDEFDQIIPDLVAMDPRNRGHVPTVERIDQANAARDAEIRSQVRDKAAEAFDQLHHAHGPDRPWRSTRVNRKEWKR